MRWTRYGAGFARLTAVLGNIKLDGASIEILQLAALYVLGWTLMTIAMMLPTTLPLLEIFRRLRALIELSFPTSSRASTP